MPPTTHIDPATIDCSHPVADLEAIRKVNPHRPPMEFLTAIVLADYEAGLIVAYKDVGEDEFWVPGHMPGYPLFPGVLMCEAAAQLASYYYTTAAGNNALLGLGGIENARFRGPVRPGDRLLLVGKAIRLDRRQTIVDVQGYVAGAMVFHVEIRGMPIPGGEYIRSGAPAISGKG